MFSLAIVIGIYSYIIFAIGLLEILHKNNIVILTFVFFIFCIVLLKKQIKKSTRFFTRSILVKAIQGYSFNNLSFLLLSLLIIQSLINLIGALGPELGFDALWYHLTLPKLYIQNHSVLHIPGSLLYYSDMPKLTEMLYTSTFFFGNEILAKLIHFSFGLLSCLALYFLSRKFFDRQIAIITVVIFYSNLVVGWQSITAYVDLARTFLELMALWGFINFWEKGERKWLIESSVMLGLAISTKLLSIGSIFIFIPLIFYYHMYYKKNTKKLLSNIITFLLLAFIIPLPWFIFSIIHTGNPFYPFFTNIYPVNINLNLFNPINFIKEMLVFFTNLSDPISPLYIIFLPFAIIQFRKFHPVLKIISIYSVFAIFLWYFTPRTGGGRFILPYLPSFSIVVAGTINEFLKNKRLYKLSIVLVVVTAFLSIGYRGFANAKYLPVILGQQSRAEFLKSRLNFSFGDFYDTDGYFEKNITSKDTVLLYGFHNLYYVDFPFIDSSWVKKGDVFNYIATQNSDLPKRFSNWELIYHNSKTHVNLYSLGGIKWAY